jgi:hypothetical protein
MSHTTIVVMMYGPVMMHGYLTCGKIVDEHATDKVKLESFWRFLAVKPITTVLDYGNKNRLDLIKLRADMEVYCGIYLIVGWFMGMSNLIGILLYWQCLRVRAMLNPQTKKAFTRIDVTLNQYVLSKVPFLRKPYDFIKNFMVSMGSPP